MHMPLGYKDLREELDEILYKLGVPKQYFHTLSILNQYIKDFCMEEESSLRALEIIELIMPRKLNLNESNSL